VPHSTETCRKNIKAFSLKKYNLSTSLLHLFWRSLKEITSEVHSIPILMLQDT